MPQTLSFSGKDVLNGLLVDGDHTIYTVTTTGGILGRKVTALQATDGSLSATLHLRKRSLDVGGQILFVDDHVKPTGGQNLGMEQHNVRGAVHARRVDGKERAHVPAAASNAPSR